MKAVIFDIDGVLIDTEQWQYESWNEALKSYNVFVSKEKYISNFSGRQGEDIDKDIIDEFKLNVPYGTLVKKKESLIIGWLKTRDIPLRPYAKEILLELKDMGIRLGAATSSPMEEAIIKLKKHGMIEYFHSITTKEEVEHSKPDPDIYLREAKKLGIDPNECVVFEDTEYGIIAAKKAGMFVIAVPTEWSIKQDFSRADVKVKDLKEGLEILRYLISK